MEFLEASLFVLPKSRFHEIGIDYALSVETVEGDVERVVMYRLTR